ncbi:MAG: glycoside hydrolase TIM-barrel-like domain-containing protein, partial [Alphaproteobacteria bacterium]|nr:glycoside hydrolase TIM-barrel-like domain-containing protein [Alphaproteobacteria bacterium]
FKKITSIRDNKNEYPAVRCLIELARQVKVILGSNVHISYAADWSEYHHDNLGYFYMDDLWSSQYIDFVGIDAYFPLTDNYAEVLEEGDVIKGWDSGELYDYYYNDKNSKFKLSPKYALKNIEYWWNSHHFNPDKTKTNWKPKSKKIWFTEFGFPSVDGCANQPNVFFDPESYDGGLPKGSKGIIDFYSQRVAINATIKRWEKSNIVENLFLWTWDARPYPSWPSFSQVWGDGNKWDKGHWVNGKFGLSLLSDVLYELCKRSGIDVKQIDTSKIIDVVDGFVIDEVVAAQDVIELLSRFYFFDVQESDGLLKFISPKSFGNHVINSSELIYNFNNNLIQIIHQDEEGLPKKIELIYSDKSKLYNQNVSRAQNYHTSSDKHLLLASNIVFSERLISKKAKELLQQIWNARHLYKIKLPFKYMFLRPGDIITLNYQDSLYHIKVSTISIIENKCLEIEGNSYIIGVCNSQYDPADIQINQENISTECNYISYALDLPARIGEFKEYNNINIAVAAKSGTFKPASIYFFYNNSYHYVTDVIKESTVGSVHDRLRDANYSIFDTENTINVSLISGSLESVSDDQILSKANMAIIGDEIVQFKNAQLVSENLYKLSVFLRGRMGTESFTDSHQPGERFILLDKNLTSVDISMQLLGFESDYFLVSDGEKLDLTENNRFTWNANSLKPLSPVHLFYEEISNEKVKISWTRRSRIGGTMRNNVDIMLHEEKECYEIDCITKLGNIDTVIRSQPYIVLDQKYFSNLSMVKVFQISGVVGRGFGSELKIQ